MNGSMMRCMGDGMRTFDEYLQDGSVRKAPFIRSLSSAFLSKARQNLATMSLLSQLSDEAARKTLGVPADYSPDEWVVICGYYSMYMASLSALAKIGYQSKSHTATLSALEELFVRQKHLEAEYVLMLDEHKVEPEDIQLLSLARNRREIAQYSVTKKTTAILASKTKEDAYKFVQRMEQLVEALDGMGEMEDSQS